MTEHGVHLHRAIRSSELIDGLAAVLSDHPLDPFHVEVIGVPTPGVERWLAQALSQRLGVAAGIEFPIVAPWLGRLWAEASADLVPGGAERDPWRTDRLTWTVLAELDRSRDEPWARALVAHLEADALGGRRYLVASRIAGLWHRYGRERPAMVTAWFAGDDVDANGDAVVPRQRWQPELWRRVRTRLAVASPAERIGHVVTTLETAPERVDLPERLSLFGLNRLDALDRALLQVLARHRTVHLWLAHPSPGRWQRAIEGDSEELWPLRGPYHQQRGRDGHRLVSTLGRDVIEFQHVLTHLESPLQVEAVTSAGTDAPATMLAALQQVLAEDRPPETPVMQHADGDTSLQVHSCHGPDRQVEVLREVICTLLADHTDLEPRDIIVMTPDLARFAPLVGAAFDVTGTMAAAPDGDALHPGRRLRIRIADQSLLQVNPLLGLVERLLGLVHGRFTASDLLDLCASPPVASRFRFSSDDLERIEELVRRSGVRWGLDLADRARFGLEGFAQNTVAAGLDRMLLGVAWSEADQQHLGVVLPLDEVESSDVDRVGRLAEFTDRLRRILGALAGPHTLTDWVAELQGVVDQLCAAEPGESWQTGHAWSVLQRLLPDASSDTGEAEDGRLLDLGDIRALLADELAGRPSRANFRTGSLTLSSLAPMRSVPHKVICLLGMDDQAFPRGRVVDGDDLLAAHPRVGDRDHRSEDRQLFLDAIMAAEQALVIVHTGHDPRTNAPRPPAIPVGELLDAVAELVVTADGSDVRDRIVVEHPLQPYDPRNFTSTAAVRSFDGTALAAARVAVAERTPVPPVFTRAATPSDSANHDGARTVGEVRLADLQRFFKHPAKAYARDRAGWIPPGDDEPADDAIPLSLDGLQKWQIGDRLLSGRLAGIDNDALVAAEWRRGTLPPKALGGAVMDRIVRDVDQTVGRAQTWREQARREIDLAVEGDGWSLTGTTTRVHGQRIVSVGYSWSDARQWQDVWWELLALTCTDPAVEWQGVAIGKNSDISLIGPVSESYARTVLADAIALRETGMTAPLPLPPKSAASYVRLLRRDCPVPDAVAKVRSEWDKESDELWTRFWGPRFDDLLTEPAISDEQRGPDADPTRFGTLARRIYLPLMSRRKEVR